MSKHDAPPPARERYHHGALREALLDACGQLLAEQGPSGFSLRECARRAGVSHGAPAHHFGDARGLLTAYATLGFERLADASRRALAAQAAAAPAVRLAALAAAYLGFALAQPAQFRLMFRRDAIDAADEALLEAGNASYDLLAATVDELLAALAPAARRERLWLVWSSVHGLATLVLDGALVHQGLDPSRPEACVEATRPVFAALAEALAAGGR
jgi:AcrR family transcriptional regulator